MPVHPSKVGWLVAVLAATMLVVLATVRVSAAGARASDARPATSRVVVDHAASTKALRRPSLGRLLAFNDFHGALDPPLGTNGLVNGIPAGGVEYLAKRVRELSRSGDMAGEKVITVGAGDMVGASPLLSAAFHDEPTIELMNQIGLQVTSVGNHEFDEGTSELRRLQRGGCHPTDGCQDGDRFKGAAFQYIAANIVDRSSRLPILPPFFIRRIKDVQVAFVGITLQATPSLVNPVGISDVDFLDEVQTANMYAEYLGLFGIKSLVLLIDQGGAQAAPPPIQAPSGCANFGGPIKSIVANLRPEYGIVVSGGTHRAYACALPNSTGASTVVTSAGANGTLITNIGFTLDQSAKTFVSITAENIVVENGIRMPDGSYAKDAAGNFIRNPNGVDPQVKKIVDKYRTAVAPIANRAVGKITADIARTSTAAAESALGDVVADGQLAYTTSAGAQIALMNPGGIRADLTYASSPGGEPPGDVTYGECFAVQPFNFLVVTQTFTGAQLKEVLEQQFAGYAGQSVTRILQVSSGFTYAYDTTRALGDRISGIALNGTPIDLAASYRVTTNDFLANGGDGFSKLTGGTNRATAPGFDVDALTAYLAAGAPVAPGPQNRITKLA